MGKLASAARAGYGVFKVAKVAVDVAKRPAWAARKFAVKAARMALLAGLRAAFGEKWAAGVVGRLSVACKSKQGSVSLPVPAWLAKWAMDAQGAALVEQVANDLMAAPFQMVGYKLAHAKVGYDEASRKLTLGLRLGVIDIEALEREAKQATVAPTGSSAVGKEGVAASSFEGGSIAKASREAAAGAAAAAVGKVGGKIGEAASGAAGLLAKAGSEAWAARRDKT